MGTNYIARGETGWYADCLGVISEDFPTKDKAWEWLQHRLEDRLVSQHEGARHLQALMWQLLIVADRLENQLRDQQAVPDDPDEWALLREQVITASALIPNLHLVDIGRSPAQACTVGAFYFTDHPEVTNLIVGRVADRTVVTGRHYAQGQLGFFIPDGAIVPDKLADEMWVQGKLAGAKRNRVRAREFKGVWSEGLFYGSQGDSWNPAWKPGDDVTKEVGVTFRDETD